MTHDASAREQRQREGSRRWPHRLARLAAVGMFLLVFDTGPGRSSAPIARVGTVTLGQSGEIVRAANAGVQSPPPDASLAAPPDRPLAATPGVGSVVRLEPMVDAEPSAAGPAPRAPDACAAALAYLDAHAAPGFAHYCRPGDAQTADGPVAAYTCVPGTGISCPDGAAEIVIAAPACAASYMNEASNSHWDFAHAGMVRPGTVQNGRTWDPYGPCPH